jgi:hypothetical protein
VGRLDAVNRLLDDLVRVIEVQTTADPGLRYTPQPDRPAQLFPEKLWIIVAVGALVGLAIVIWRAQLKRRKELKNSKTL